MLIKNITQIRALFIFLSFVPLYAYGWINSNSLEAIYDGNSLVNADTSTASSTIAEIATSSQTQTVTPTNTDLSDATETITPTPSSTITTRPSISATPTKTIDFTRTPTPNYTKTIGPSETFVPLPSITLLFPIETATDVQAIDSNEKSTPTIEITNPSQILPEMISSRSVLLIGIIFFLWVILASFIIFYLQRLLE